MTEANDTTEERLFEQLRRLFVTGDLTAELSDKGVGVAINTQWHIELGSPAFLGLARVTDAADGDVSAVHETVTHVLPGEVMVVDASRSPGAVFGGGFASIAVERGAAGVLVDGLVRDVAQMKAAGVALRARGSLPTRGRGDGNGGTGGTIEVGGVKVADGDLVLVDSSGAVVVSRGRFGELAQFVTDASKH